MSDDPYAKSGTVFVVLGAGGHAMSVHDVITSTGGIVGLFAGDTPGGSVPAAVAAGDEQALELAARQGYGVLVGIGDNDLRCRVFSRIPDVMRAPAIVAATATVADSASLGAGTVVHHHAHVGPRTTVGAAVIVNTSAVVEHDCHIEDGVHVAPGAVLLGDVRVGAQTLIGSGARVLPGIRVGRGATVGAGAIVVRDVQDGVTVAGVPATQLKGEHD